jgi:hypothetical protein
MKLLTNGDSNMIGEELEDRSLGMANQMSELLNATEHVNLSLSGSSNDRIYDSTMEYIKSNLDVDMVIIGWSEPFRVQWFLTDQGYPEFWEINNLGIGRQPPAEYQLRREHWNITSKHEDRRTGLSHYWHERIYNLHQYLEYHKIPHLFFHAFHDFRINESQFQLNWNEKFLHPYDNNNSYIHWCEAQGFKEITPGFFHFEPAGHRAWAEKVVNHIKQHNILQ